MNILAIEDCMVNYFLLEGILNDYHIDRISSLNEATSINYSDYQLIFLDLNLEVILNDKTRQIESGMPIYQHIRKSSDVPIIFFTAYPYDSIKNYISDDKNSYYLSKHFQSEDLIDLVNAITRL